MQTLVYIIGGYCLIKAVLLEIAVELNPDGKYDKEQKLAVLGATAFLFLAAIEAFNQ
jgi:hypothetical protein